MCACVVAALGANLMSESTSRRASSSGSFSSSLRPSGSGSTGAAGGSGYFFASFTFTPAAAAALKINKKIKNEFDRNEMRINLKKNELFPLKHSNNSHNPTPSLHVESNNN